MTLKLVQQSDTPLVMGILNVTPDSFSDGGVYYDTERAVQRGLEMVAEGADILDVGGESTRPGSEGVSVSEECRRVLPVIEALAARTDSLISVDTVKPEVARAAVEAGAHMLNDVSTLRNGVALAELAAEHNTYLVLMHSRGTPETMQQLTDYDDVVSDVISELSTSVDKAMACGVARDRIWLDPGIGFAKTADQNLALIERLEELTALGFPVLVGPSRKSFIGKICSAEIDDRLGGTAAAVTVSIMKGASAVRVHDVSVMKQATQIARAIISSRRANRHGEVANA